MPVHLVSHWGAAEPAPVFIFVTFRQNQEKGLDYRHCFSTLGAIELCGLKLAVACLFFLFGIYRRISKWSLHNYKAFPFFFYYATKFLFYRGIEKMQAGNAIKSVSICLPCEMRSIFHRGVDLWLTERRKV